MSGKKRFSYDASFKLKVTAYAIEHNNNIKAARESCVSEKLVRGWKKAMKKLEKSHRKRRLVVGFPLHMLLMNSNYLIGLCSTDRMVM